MAKKKVADESPEPAPESAPEQAREQEATAAAPEERGVLHELKTWRDLACEVAPVWWLLPLCVVASLGLRLYDLGGTNLWMDEVALYRDAIAGTNQYVSAAHRFHLRMVGWFLNNVSDSDAGLRLWSALAGSLTPVGLGLAGLWLAGRRGAVMCATLAVVSPLFAFYGRDGNYYGVTMCLAGMQLALFVAFFRGAPVLSFVGAALVGYVAHYHHPTSTAFTGLVLGTMALGALVVPSARRQLFSANPFHWLARPGVLLVVAALIGGFLVRGQVLGLLRDNIKLGATFHNIAFGPSFFTTIYTEYLVTKHNAEGIARVLVWIPFVLGLGGVVSLFSRGLRKGHWFALGMLAVIVPIATYFLVFNIDVTRNFRARYIIYQAPLVVLVLGFLLAWWWERFGTEDNSPRARLVALAPLALVLLVQVPFLFTTVFGGKRDFQGAVQVLREQAEPDEEILLFLVGLEDIVLERYMGTGDDAMWPSRIGVMRSLPRVVEQGRSSMIYHLYGRERAWVLRAWLDFYREHLGRILEPVYLGNLRRDDLERSEVYQWDYGTRVLLRGAATRFPADGPLLAAREGEWILRPAAGTESLRDLTISPAREDDPAPEITRLPDGAVRVSATGPVRLVMAGGDASLMIEARPVLPEAFTFGPMDTTNYTLDSRCRLEQDSDGNDVAYSPFNTYYSYLLWAEPGEERQLVLRVYPRNRETIGRDLGLKTQAELQRHDPNLWFLVSVDGVHVGAYQLQASDSGDMVRLPLGIRLPPGPHRVAIHGMTPKLGHQPYNPWRWGGLEWNKEWSGEVAPRLEEGGLQFAAAPEPFIPWGDAETGGLSTRIVNPGGPGYARALADEPGAFGRGVLEFDLAMTPEQKQKGYEYILGEPVAVEPGKWFHFGAHLRNLGSQNHHVALAVMFLGANGQRVSPGAMIGNQQKLAPELHTGWVRFTELVPIPRGVARIAPGVIVFPPDTRRTSPAGRIAVDSIYFPTQIEGFAHQPDLSESLFWEVETGDSEVGTD